MRRYLLLAFTILLFCHTLLGAPFTPGNLVVYRVNDGAAAIAATGTAVFLDEYTTAGVLVQSIPVPTTTVGAQRRLVCSGTATTEGFLTRSSDGQYIVFSGYDAALGTASITTSTSATVPRVIGRVGPNGTIDTSTALTDAISGGNPRGATSTNGTDLWLTGTSGGGGIRYATFGATTSTSLATTPTNLRAVNIFGGQLYVSSQSGAFRLASVGTGTPTTAGQTITNLPGFPTATGSPYQFFFADLNAGVAGVDTVYVADDGGTIQKYSLVGGNWTANGTIALATARGITGTVSGSNVTLYVTARTTLRTLTDTSGYNATITGSVTTLATAAANTAFQGVAFSPTPAVALPNLTINDISQAETNAGTTTFTFQVSLSAPAGPGGVTFDIATADGTAQDDNPATEDNDYVAQSLTGQTIPAGSSTYAFNVTVNGDVIPEANETFFVNVTNVVNANVTDGQGQGTIQNDDASCADLSINDVTQLETNGGTTTFAFTVSLSQAGCGTVTFDIATADGTAQDDNPATEDNDYVPQSLTGQTITFPSTYTFNVTVNSDLSQEPDQTFFVNITNVSPGNVQVIDGQGLGTIVNDDFTPIHDIQGPGASSPIVGSSVTTRGIVTGVKSNGYFIQEPDASVDADPATSEGIFVFTSVAPPAAATIGSYVEVTSTVVEFVPSADPLQPPLTELSSPTTVQISTGNPLPAAIPLSATFPDPAGPHDQLERLEGMRVSVASLTVGAPTMGFKDEANATSTTSGVFLGTVTGVARAQREPGIQAPDPAPSGGSIPPIPRWDFNPETIRVDSDGLTGVSALDVSSTTTVTGLVGPLDFTFRRYTILPGPGAAVGAIGGMTPTSASAMTGRELTVAAYNMERFYDDIDDGGTSDVALTSTAFNNRLNKASLGVRNNLGTPDILGVVEMENLSTLQALATKINNDAVAAVQPNPNYVAYLIEGNDIGGIDVGFLVKTAIVFGSTPRVTVNAVVQELDGTLFVNPDSSTETLNDRPPLRLDAVVNDPNGATFPVTVIVVHQRSLNSVNDESVGSNGWPTAGARVRAKRQKQAEDLANLIQTRQTNDPTERIIVLGDFNAYEFNDGLADAMNVVHGTPSPDNETAVPGDGADLVNPDLDNLWDSPPAGERYSYVFDGQTQNIDHMLVNQALINATVARRIEHPRINADFQEVARGNAASAVRLSDHDPLVGFFEVNAFGSADVSMDKTLDTAGPYVEGQSVTYTLTIANAGPDPATAINVTDTTTNLSITSVTGACASLPCTIANLAAGANTTITVTATIMTAGAFDNSADATAAEPDPNTGNNTDNTLNGGTAAALANVSITKTLDTAGPYTLGQTVTYTIVVANSGPSTATNINVTDAPTNLNIQTVSSTNCSAFPCVIPSLASGGNETITVTATIPAAGAFDNSATATAAENDPDTSNNTDNTSNGGNAIQANEVTSTKSVSGTFLQGSNVTYTVVITNGMTVTQPDNFGHEFTDILPAGLTLVSVNATSGTTGSVSNIAFWDGSIPSGGTVTLTIVATISPTATGTISNQGQTIFDRDGDGQNESSRLTDDPSTAAVDDPTTFRVIQANEVLSTKSVSGTFVQGTNVTYTIVMTNNMTVTQPDNFGHEWTDNLPAGLTLVSVNATSGTTGSVSNIAFWDGSIPSGGTVTLTIVATISPTATGTISNQGQTIFDRDGDGQNESSHLTDDPSTAAVDDPTNFTVTQANGVVSTKSVGGTFVQGSNITYTVVMTNNMTVMQPDNFGHEWTDNLPAGLTLVSVNATSGATGSVSNIAFWDGSIPSGGTVTLTIVATINPTATGMISNQGQTIFDRDGDGQNESSHLTDDPSTAAVDDPTSFTVLQSGIVDVTKSVSGTFAQGSNVTYTITLTNNMTVTQTDNAGDELTDSLPPQLTLVSSNATSGTAATAANNVTWNGSIPAGGSVTITIVATISTTASGTVSNQGSGNFDANGDNLNESTELSDDPSTAADDDPTVFTILQSGIVEITKTVAGTFVQGTNVTYTITLTNNMTVTQTDNAGDEFTDSLPPQLILVSANATSGTAITAANNVTWNGSIPAGGSVTITIVATISPTASGTVSNQGSSNFDANGDNLNESTELSDDPSTAATNDPTSFTALQSGIVEITKTVSGTFVQGTNVTYTVTLTNNMSVTQADNAGDEFTDSLPPQLTFVSANASIGTASAVGSNVAWNGPVPTGGSVTITIVASISPTASGTVSNQGSSFFDTNGDGGNDGTELSDDPSTAAVNDPTNFNVIQSGIVEITKSVTGSFVQGTNVTYTIVLTNNMSVSQPDNAGNEFTDSLPAQLTLVSANASSGTAAAAGNDVTWNGSIPPGGSVNITIVATINLSATGVISNQGSSLFDQNGDATNEGTELSDDPSTAGVNDPTSFTVIPAIAPIPTMSEWMLLMLAAMLASIALRRT